MIEIGKGEVKRGKIPAQSWTAFGFLWFIFAINGNIRELLNRLAPYIVKDYGIDATTFGLLSTAAFVAIAVGSIPIGLWADRGGIGWMRKYRSFIVALGYLIPTFLCGISVIGGIFAAFFVLNVIRGLFSGAGEACEVGQVVEWTPKEKSGFFVGTHHTSYPWGVLIGGLLITLMLTTLGGNNYRIIFLFFPIVGVIMWLLFLKWANAKNYALFQKNTMENGYTPPLGGDGDVENYTPPPGLVLRCLKNPNILMMIFVGACCLFGYAGINFWLTPYITFVGNYDPAAAASLSVVFTITGGLGQIFWGNLSDSQGSKRTLLICIAWLIIMFFMMKFAYISLVWLIVLQLIMGFALNAVYAMIYKYIAISSEKGGVVVGNSLCLFGLYGGGAIATYVLGAAIDAGGGWSSPSGYNTGLIVLAGVMVAAFLLTLLFTRETNGPKFKKDFSLVSLESCNLADIDDPISGKH